jgi:hypothetical protein
LLETGFENVSVDLKEESREFIKDWMPGSGCEDYVVSATVVAFKPKRVVAPLPLLAAASGGCGSGGKC